MTDDALYTHVRHARRRQSVASIMTIWVGLFVLWVTLDAAIWIVLAIAAFTLPAIWDMVRDTHARVEVWPARITWVSALGAGDHANIDHVRMNRRFDGGMKITLVHVGGAQTRLPPDIAPPPDAFQSALETAGIAVQRHPFSPI